MPVLLVDGMSVLKTTAGAAAHLRRGFAYSFMIQLTSAMTKFKPETVMVCWEGGYGGRDKIDPNYKSNRKPTNDAIREQRAELKKLLSLLGVDQAFAEGYEADDVIAHFCEILPVEKIIFSNDKDFLQLVGPKTSVYQRLRHAGATGRELITHENFESLTGWRNPELFFRGQLALGDAVDCVPKLYGISPATAHAYFHDIPIKSNYTAKLDEFYADSDHMIRNSQLMSLRNPEFIKNVEITFGDFDFAGALDYLTELGFASITKRYADWVVPYEDFHADIPT